IIGDRNCGSFDRCMARTRFLQLRLLLMMMRELVELKKCAVVLKCLILNGEVIPISFRMKKNVFGHPTAIPVGPTHLDWPGPETLGTVNQTNDAHRPTPVPEEVVSRHAPISEDAYTFQREEAKRTAEKIRNERAAQNRIKAQLLAEMKADREEKRRNRSAVRNTLSVSSGHATRRKHDVYDAAKLPKPRQEQLRCRVGSEPHFTVTFDLDDFGAVDFTEDFNLLTYNAAHSLSVTNHLTDFDYRLPTMFSCALASGGTHDVILVHPGGSSNTPITLEFPSSAVYGDLLSNLQNLVLPANQPPSVQLTAAPTNSPALSALRYHLKSIRVTDQCFQLITTNWPRQTLPRCTTLNVEDAHDSNACLTQSLVSLGLSDGSGVSVRHVSANCPFEAAVVAEQTHTVSHPSTENPAADLLPNDPSRDADSEPDTPPPGNEFSLAFPPGGQQLVPQPPGGYMPRSGRTLMENLPEQYSTKERCVNVPIHVSAFQDTGLQCWMRNFISVPCPIHCISSLFPFDFHNRTSCVTSLNLNYYPLVTTELITCLVSKWPHLTELQLNGLQTGQIQPETVDQLGALRNLRLLSLNGLSSVCDRNIRTLINLPELRILRLAGTSVTDAGWIQMAASSVTSSRPLAELDASGLRNNLTSRGLEAIVQLFPNLHHLTIAASEPNNGIADFEVTSMLLTGFDTRTRSTQRQVKTYLPTVGSFYPQLVTLRPVQVLLFRLFRSCLFMGHPLQHLDGLESIPSLDASLLERYCAHSYVIRIAGCAILKEARRTTRCTDIEARWSKWLERDRKSELFFFRMYRKLSDTSFPLRKTNPPADSGECSPTLVLSQLGRFHRLQTLDLGGQISEESEVRVLKQIVPQLPDLHYLAVSNLPVAHLVVGAERISTCQSVTVAAIIVSEDDPAARCVLLSAPPDTLWTNLFDARPLSHILRSSPNLTLLLNAAMFHSHPPVRSFSPSIPIPDGMCADLGTVTTTEPVSRCNRTRGFTQAAFSSPHNEVDNREKQLRETGENAWTQTLSDHLKQRCEEAVNYRTQVRFRRGGHVDQRNPAFHTGVDDNSQTVDSKPQQTKVAVDADPSAQMDMGIL
ncbi:hypothetical protein CLF_108386, partial [Clonorchis sinensis]